MISLWVIYHLLNNSLSSFHILVAATRAMRLIPKQIIPKRTQYPLLPLPTLDFYTVINILMLPIA
jgi:hypothetical protein